MELDALFPQELSGSPLPSPFDPTCPSSSEMLNLSDLSAAQNSIFGSNVGVGFDGSLQDLTSYDDPYFVDSLYSDGRENFHKFACDGQDQASVADFCSQDSWITTPVSLPPTPEGTAPNSPAMFLPGPCPSASQTPLIQSPYPPSGSQAPSSHDPLTPESLPSPNDFEEDKNLKEILSFLVEDSSVVMPANQVNPFQLPPSQDQQSPVSNPDDCSSVYSLLSTPQSPLSPNLQTSPELLPRTYAPSDTIHVLLANGHTQPSAQPHTPPASDDVCTPSIGDVTVSAQKHQRSSSSAQARPPQKKRRVNPVSRKERKREQNKTAALRYRQKKKEEKGEVEEQRLILEEKNQQLRKTLSSLEAETAYLRKLWEEVERARTSQQAQH